MPYVYSTLTADTAYCAWERAHSGEMKAQRTILIQGGANLANKYIETPKGVATFVTDENLEILEKDPTFQFHVEKGFLTIEDRKIKTDIGDRKTKVDKVVKNMEEKDRSAPKTSADYTDPNKPKPFSRND